MSPKARGSSLPPETSAQPFTAQLPGSSVQVFSKSSESMRELEDNSVTLTVTSPPYHDILAYDEYASGRPQNTRKVSYRKGYSDYTGYLALMQRVFTEVYRVTRPGGFLALNVSNILHDGVFYPIPADLTRRMLDIGWILQEDICWHKGRSVSDRAGTFALHKSPFYFYTNACTESILVFRKPGPKLFQSMTKEDKELARIPLTPLVTKDVMNNVWCIPPVRGGKLRHPAPFPDELPARLILLYSLPGDVVLDPFCGSGTTLKAARGLGRSSVGYELEEQFAQYARDRAMEPLALRRSQPILKVEHVDNDPFLDIGRIERSSHAPTGPGEDQ